MQSSGGGPVSTLFASTDKGFGSFLQRIPLYPEGLRFIRQDAAVFGGADDFGDDDAEFVAQALAELPDGPWTETTWSEWTSNLKAKTERKGKTLFMPLRLALTGSEHGPEMQNLLPLIGEEKTRQRLSGAAG